ncbi:MAG: type II secretion system protein N [Desulfurivibrionaceae bacterium]|nr:type II secretion system protein N [Desulfurivibrionaceae bacterium]
MNFSDNLMTAARESLTGGNALRKWRILLGLVLAVLLAQTGASLTWKIVGVISDFGEGFTPKSIAVKKPRDSGDRSIGGHAGAPLEEPPLFGLAVRVENSSRSPAADSGAAPKTTLALVLKGIVTVESMQRALAVIAEKGKGDEELYSVGDKVPGNAEISEIHGDRVLLRRGGVLETLMMEQDDQDGLSMSSRETESAGGADEAIIDLGDGVHWRIDNSYLEQRLGDIPTLAREVGVEVYKEGDVQQGYRLVSARGSKLLRELGLQPGDVLHEVNGVKLDTIQGGLSAYQQIRNAEQIRVVISRNGRRETRMYEINHDG